MKTINLNFGRSLVLSFLMITFTSVVQAQSYIDEDFLENLEKNAHAILEEPNQAFKEVKTPAKWDNESAVVIGYSRAVLFDRQSRGGFLTRKERSLWFVEKNRLKIKLNDNNSVQAFSEIYFRYGAKEDGFIARILKKDGTTNTIDLKNAVGVESVDEVPEFFKSFFDKVANSQYHYYKTPVADLEPGDILEYVAATKSKLDVTSSGYIEFMPIYEVCSKQYPMLHNEIVIETDDKSFFKYLSLNGAPKFTKETAADKEFFRYVFVDKNRATEKDVNFVSPLLQYPLVKFQVIYANNDQAKGALIGEKGELKSQFSKEELAQKAWEDYMMVDDLRMSDFVTVGSFIKQCWSELSKLGAKNWSENQYVETVYYQLRNKVVFRDNYYSDKVFAYMFGALLAQRDIKSDLVISVSNNIGKLSEVLFDSEIRYAIKVGDKLYYNMTDFSNPGELSETLLNNDAYILSAPPRKSNTPGLAPFTLPGTVAADNVKDEAFKVELSADMKKLMVVRTTSYKGLQKANSSAAVLKYTPYMFDDYKNYGGNHPTEDMKSKQADEYNNTVRTMKDEFKKQKVESVKQALQSEYEQEVSNIHFEVVADGRSKKKPVLIVKEGFELSDFVRRAGKKYLVNLSGLMGSQLQIKPDERERQNDIDVRHPKTYTWNISFKIPDGYKAEGLSEINRSVDNEAGTFTLAAREESGSVLINITKVYKQRNIPKDKWKDMLAFIDEAYNSSFRYILLSPKQ